MFNAYDVIENRHIDDLNSDGIILKHKKTGARVVLMPNDDDNKVFYIGFRTPPYDSTGLPHILEHSVLCGSRKYPLKDPFVELAKGSLNTFLNAMTYPDKTVYPVASCNDKDFQNLLDVYLDAVFYPNIYNRPEIFKQEGWRYELDNKDGDIIINGVVYNEMKGAFSSPDSILDRQVLNSLYPDTAYGVESGGDPQDIPKLSFEKFLDFHKKYYHPSNSYIFLYGNCDMEEKLDYIDKEYLSKFDKLEIDSSIKSQTPFNELNKKEIKYSITMDEPLEENCYFAYNFSLGTCLDRELYLALLVLDYALMDAPGAIVMERLLKAGIAKDFYSSYENGILQPYYSFCAKGADKDKAQEFIKIIRDTLEEIVSNGFDKDTLLASINKYEFKYREADFGRYPKGLMYGLQSLDSWLYDDSAPFIHIEAIETLSKLKEKVNEGYYEELIKKYFLENNHASLVVLEPERGLNSIKDEAKANELKKYKDSLSDEEINNLVEESKALKLYQETPDSEENLNCLPVLDICDIKKEFKKIEYEIADFDGVEVVFNDKFTRGIGYLNYYFDISELEYKDYCYVTLYTSLLGYVDSEKYSYSELANLINLNVGGIKTAVLALPEIKENSSRIFVNAKYKATYDKLITGVELLKEFLMKPVFSDNSRIKELISMIRSRIQSSLSSGGHVIARDRAFSYIFENEFISEYIHGLEYYKFICELDDNFDSEIESVKEKFSELQKKIFNKNRLIINYTAEKKSLEEAKKASSIFTVDLALDEIIKTKRAFKPEKLNEGYKMAGQIQYVALCGDAFKNELKYTGALRVLQTIMSYDYLWLNVRVKGGAYGCMTGVGRTGKAFFVSYRDPNLKETLDIYKQCVDYIKNFNVSDRDLTKFIIGTIAGMDMPKNPYDEGINGFISHVFGISNEDYQLERDEVLNCSNESIRALYKYFENLISDECLCVVGSETKIDENKDLFLSTKSLV